MKRKSIVFAASLCTFSIALGVVLTQGNIKENKSLFNVNADETTYTLNLDSSSNAFTNLTASYQNNVTQVVNTNYGNELTLNVVNGKSSDGNLLTLAPHGKIYNFGNLTSSITGITAITATYSSGSLSIKTAKGAFSTGVILGDKVALSSGDKVDLVSASHFEIEAGDSATNITSLSIEYKCVAQKDVSILNGIYTGVGNDAYTYKLIVNNGIVRIESLDMLNNIGLDGTVTMLTSTQAKCTFVYNTYNIYYTMNYDGHAFTFVSKDDDVGGAAAGAITTINTFNRVYNVEDFESYSQTGQGYTSAENKYKTTGLRAKYYADYYTGSSSGEIGGSGWPVMTSTDNSNLASSKGREGSKGGIFKFSNGNSMRYLSMDELYGVPSYIGKGATLSFWARGAYSNSSFTTDYAKAVPSVKIYAYFAPQLTPSTQSSAREEFVFDVPSGTTWNHYEMPLTAGRAYYGFGIWAQQSTGAAVYIPFDDFEIYTASPYKTYAPRVDVTGVALDKETANVGIDGTVTLNATVSPADATNKNVTWTSSNTSVATVDNGVVTGVSTGNATITVATVDGGFTDTCEVTVQEYIGGTFYTQLTSNLNIIISLGKQGQCAVRVANTDLNPTGYSYNPSTKQVSIVTTGSVSTYTLGTITGTYDAANNRLTNVSCTGNASQLVNKITIPAMGADQDSALYSCSGTTDQLRGIFKRRYKSGNSWVIDESNTDRITQNTAQYVTGNSSMKVRGFNGQTGLNLLNNISNKTFKSIGYWVYNPSASDVNLSIYVYKAADLSQNGNPGTLTAIAGQWTYCCCGIGCSGFTVGTNTLYNFQLFLQSNVYLSYDEISLYI